MRIILKRIIVPLVCFAAVFAALEPQGWKIQRWIVDTAKARGVQMSFESRAYGVGVNGPFAGDDFKARAWNFAFRHGEWLTIVSASFATAALAYLVISIAFGRARLFSYRGPTRCGRCRYALAGLTTPRCPECGTQI